jgi:hypothetical protein
MWQHFVLALTSSGDRERAEREQDELREELGKLYDM